MWVNIPYIDAMGKMRTLIFSSKSTSEPTINMLKSSTSTCFGVYVVEAHQTT